MRSEGLSLKRTDLEIWRDDLVLSFFCAAAKSEVRDGSLGLVRVGDDEEASDEESNCAVSSDSWERRRGSCDIIELRGRLLAIDVEWGPWAVAYSSGMSSTCDSSDSMPERNCSRDLEIWPSWLLEGRFSDRARCRSSSESLMWSARRNSWGGLVVIVVVLVLVVTMMCDGAVDGGECRRSGCDASSRRRGRR